MFKYKGKNFTLVVGFVDYFSYYFHSDYSFSKE